MDFDLDQPLIELVSSSGRNSFTVRHAVEGVQIFGGIGSGKSSGSGRMLALKYLAAGFGGLVLCVKETEAADWKEFARLTGRTDDLIVLENGGPESFNFLEYESAQANGEQAITENIVEVLQTVIKASKAKDQGRSDDAFWETALDMLIFNVIDLCKLAYGKVSVIMLYDIVQTIPKNNEQTNSTSDTNEAKAFHKAFETARQKVTLLIEDWRVTLSPEQQERMEDDTIYEAELLDAIPDARLLKLLDQFFFDSLVNLSEKTRSIIDFTFSGFLFRLLREPVYSLFCRSASTLTPEDSLQGKIIVLDLPVKRYHKFGRDAQILFKYIWQRSIEQRHVADNGRPVFLWADEAQHFLHEHDVETQATARSSRIATVYITQNLPSYFTALGGVSSEYRVKSFLGTLASKLFHANADSDTNKYASELIGEAYFVDENESVTVAKDFSQTRGHSFKLEKVVRPEEFVSLKTGGPLNNQRVEAYLHRQGDSIMNGQNHVKMTFNQNYKP